MDAKVDTSPKSVARCSLRKLSGVRTLSASELSFISTLKSGELKCNAGATVVAESSYTPHIFTVVEGWGFRYKTMEDGRRQVLNYLLPGDMIGLQGAVLKEMDHSVEALTPMRLCMFERSRFFTLFEKQPSLAYDVTWLAAREERILDEHLLSIGRRTAIERAAYLIAFLHHRGTRSGQLNDEDARLPITQNLVADTLGLSIVHTNKTLRKLATRKLLSWKDKGCDVLDPAGLAAVAQWEPPNLKERGAE
ncbi:Crp/Fnr family transcriptional regulator [Agrobacterium sp. ES01]|uniref:Crp/Fnr family transcriptional regulator n=1 Tax=Agrobacterium sp. ES01 TaxID=3420714 RepID=UPI003D0E7D08